MTRNGRQYLAIPGPSVMPDRVLAAMHRASPDIYAGELPEMAPGIVRDLKALARTSQHVAIYIANGHGAWEAANANMFSREDAALALVTGRFGEGWAQYVSALGVEVTRLDFGKQGPVDPTRVAEALRADASHRIRAVVMSHVDTTTSVRNDVAAVRAAIDEAGHPALLAVDCIASLGCDVFEMDGWGVDVMVCASQKGMMTPPGLGFVWVSDRAKAACAGSGWRTPYWDWTPRIEAHEFYQYFGGTAPTHHLYGLRTALDMLLHEEGIEAVWRRHRTLARAVWAAVDAWGSGNDGIGLNVAEPEFRSHAVTTTRFAPARASELRRWVEANTGVTLGVGLGMGPPQERVSDGYLRIGHMGHVNAHMTLGVLGALEAGMQALGIAHGKGGLAAAAAVIAGA